TAVATSRALLGGGGELRAVAWSLRHPSEVAVMIFLGVVAGLVALVYVRVVHFAEERIGRLRLRPELRATIGGLLVGCIGLVAPRVLGTGIETMNAALAGRLALETLVIALICKLLATSLTLGSGSPGGSFFPAVFVGAMLGGAFGAAAHAALPGIASSAGAYAAVGMGSVVAGVTLAPLTGVVMMFELTGSYQIVLPLLVACGISAAVVQGVLGGSIYTIGARRRGVHLSRGAALSELSVAQAMLDPQIDRSVTARAFAHEAQTLRPDDDLGTALQRLAESGATEAVVVDEQGRPVGVVTREGILEAWRRATLPG